MLEDENKILKDENNALKNKITKLIQDNDSIIINKI